MYKPAPSQMTVLSASAVLVGCCCLLVVQLVVPSVQALECSAYPYPRSTRNESITGDDCPCSHDKTYLDEFHTYATRIATHEEPKYVVYRCKSHCGGFADRIRGIATTLAIAVATDRHIVIDWHHAQAALEASLEPRNVDWRPRSTRIADDLERRSGSNYMVARAMGRTSKLQWHHMEMMNAQYYAIETNKDSIRDVLKQSSAHRALLSAFNSDPRGALGFIGAAFHFLFRPSMDVQLAAKELQSAARRYAVHMDDREEPDLVIGWHFRAGGSTDERGNRLVPWNDPPMTPYSALEDYRICNELIKLDCVKNGTMVADTWFLMSDSDKVLEAAHSHWKRNVVFASETERHHHLDFAGPASVQDNLQLVLSELLALASMDFVICGRSGLCRLGTAIRSTCASASCEQSGVISFEQCIFELV